MMRANFFIRQCRVQLIQLCMLILFFTEIAVAGFSVPSPQTSPVIFDNDDPRDSYSEEYLMALASAGSVILKGIITSSSHAPYNRWVSEADYESFVNERSDLYARALKSGFRNVPAPVRGVKGYFGRPATGKIDDTVAKGSPGGMLILGEGRKASPDRPLVVIVGGALSAVADAYLMDPTIADRVVVMFMGFADDHIENGYNGWQDGWATFIVFSRMRVIRYRSVGHESKEYDPLVPKSRILSDLPDTPLREAMYAKQHPTNALPDGRDVDVPPAIHFMRHDYVSAIRWQSVSSEATTNGHVVPALRDNPSGNIMFCTQMNKSIATAEWWRALTDPEAWHESEPPRTSSGVGPAVIVDGE